MLNISPKKNISRNNNFIPRKKYMMYCTAPDQLSPPSVGLTVHKILMIIHLHAFRDQDHKFHRIV